MEIEHFDLCLNWKKSNLFDSFFEQDLSSFVTKSVKEIEHVMNVGNQNRAVGWEPLNQMFIREKVHEQA